MVNRENRQLAVQIARLLRHLDREGRRAVLSMASKYDFCYLCGEAIPNPIVRDDGVIACSDCYLGGKDKGKINLGPSESGEAADRQYHGGMFHSGEW